MIRMLRKRLLNLLWTLPAALLLYLLYYVGHPNDEFDGYERVEELPPGFLPSKGPAAEVKTVAMTHSTVSVKPTQKSCQRLNSFVFIKTHKSGSTTMIAPFQKYAYLYNLTMMVPSSNNNIHLSWPFRFMPSVSNMPAPGNRKFQALVNHIVFNKTSIEPLMDVKTAYITILREPAPHLVSAYQYFSVNFDNVFLRKSLTDFELFLSDPTKHDPVPTWMQKMKNTEILSLTRNLQSADLGLHYTEFDNLTSVRSFVNGIEKDFSIILVLERLAESLVLMKRKFCWSMEDVIHVNKNVQKIAWNWNFRNISQHLIPKIYEWNNVDTELYRMANDKLNKLRLGETDLDEEIKVYNNINTKVSQYCAGSVRHWIDTVPIPEPLVIDSTKFNNRFVVDRRVCGLLVVPEEDFTLLHKCRQYPDYKQCNDQTYKVNELRSLVGH
ncbi:galactosylceramide sulfotransferase-like [Watersipora subatra]|uniref:galactosylceramide sulfotransferase-like n=1 Tax=Watersipora subatra TaxID=2589382 RepID=UPI00355C0579